MPSVSKKIAEQEIEKLNRQKQPKVYCVVRYQNRMNGDDVRGSYSCYCICYKRKHYQALMRSPVIGGVDIIWSSKKFKDDIQESELLST